MTSRWLLWLGALFAYGAGLVAGTLLGAFGARWWAFPLAFAPFLIVMTMAAREAGRRDE